MELLAVQSESVNIEDCVKDIVSKSQNILSSKHGIIRSSKIRLTFGAFMNLTVTLLLDSSGNNRKGILADYSPGKHKEDAIQRTLEKLNSALPRGAQIVDFEIGTYTTPVTRRTYAVGIVVYNAPLEIKSFTEYTIKERRELLAKVLENFNYNPRVLNISEIARMFGVSRDSIYYDIEQILRDRKRH
ncbi:hypothetical protein [Thermococcus thioreducens]|uniref:Helix-turn-helix type 11 domain-containing protein n=1 Tax=Thermococcus thioreducens TaxID=277988 RepID=A0A0Q2M4R9_9EURY|nr:hypothetical protein [Thermococcus thioreducens]ASJ12281.1 hypothetical protein A3L14_04975 [Thermococcus thioreducens]KQH83017.1 hypothetical protein AMR53_01970 [Thermococcus thioreducens]SEV93599.1 hypothetical protein SAMN05216170_0972 [Thermococcus thioreducens]